jgi:hypothetical protein
MRAVGSTLLVTLLGVSLWLGMAPVAAAAESDAEILDHPARQRAAWPKRRKRHRRQCPSFLRTYMAVDLEPGGEALDDPPAEARLRSLLQPVGFEGDGDGQAPGRAIAPTLEYRLNEQVPLFGLLGDPGRLSTTPSTSGTSTARTATQIGAGLRFQTSGAASLFFQPIAVDELLRESFQHDFSHWVRLWRLNAGATVSFD